jgi:hypothetical protein
MEQKIKALVDAIARASDATFDSVGGVDRIGEPAKWLSREVHALQRLVNASIVALRNAKSDGHHPTENPNVELSRRREPTVPSTRMHHQQKMAREENQTPTSSVSSSLSNHASNRIASQKTMPTTTTAAGAAAATAGLSVEALIQKRRAQLQKEKWNVST